MSTTENGVVPIGDGIVPEVLIGKENYEEWSIRLRTYLIAHDVWDIVESTPDEAEDKANWKRKDATALHAIHISCGPDAFSAIKHIRNAKEAWDTLAKSATMADNSPATADLRQDNISADVVLKHEPLNKAVWNGNWRAIERIVTRDPDVVRARITFSERTALHVAAMAGHICIVRILVQKMSAKDLEITDRGGMTALDVAVTCNAEPSIAKCMVQKNIGLLTPEANNNMVPVAMAFSYGHRKMSRYLYSITPSNNYLKEKEHGARILCDAMHMQSFGTKVFT